MSVEKVDKALKAVKRLKKRNRVDRLVRWMMYISFVVILAGGAWHIVQEWKWMVNDTAVSYSDRWEFMLSGPIYFYIPGLIIYGLWILIDSRR